MKLLEWKKKLACSASKRKKSLGEPKTRQSALRSKY